MKKLNLEFSFGCPRNIALLSFRVCTVLKIKSIIRLNCMDKAREVGQREHGSLTKLNSLQTLWEQLIFNPRKN